MAPTKADFTRLQKLLAMTTSDQDGEALAAIRQANALMKRTGIDWRDLLVVLERGTIAMQEKSPAAAEIDEAFDLLLATTRGSFREFIENLLEQWTERGTLSPKQRGAVLRAAARARGDG